MEMENLKNSSPRLSHQRVVSSAEDPTKQSEQELLPLKFKNEIEEHSPIRGNPWKPGVWERFPWTGLGALFGVVTCMSFYIQIIPSSERLSIAFIMDAGMLLHSLI
jgi:hypothetical protein